MDEKPSHFLQEWRLYRELTQDQLADRVNTAKGVISLLENGKRPLSEEWLRRLAGALNTRAGHILDVSPSEIDHDLLHLWGQIAEEDRPQALRVLKAFVRSEPSSSE